jgi:hypothetical protein
MFTFSVSHHQTSLGERASADLPVGCRCFDATVQSFPTILQTRHFEIPLPGNRCESVSGTGESQILTLNLSSDGFRNMVGKISRGRSLSTD